MLRLTCTPREDSDPAGHQPARMRLLALYFYVFLQANIFVIQTDMTLIRLNLGLVFQLLLYRKSLYLPDTNNIISSQCQDLPIKLKPGSR